MLAHRKTQEKSDPVREILARVEARQSETGLSLFMKEPNTCSTITQGKLPSVHNAKSSSKSISHSKSTSLFPDVYAAREKAQMRFRAEVQKAELQATTQRGQLQRTLNKKPSKRMNMTFPPALPYNRNAFGNIGVSDVTSKQGISMNPFGYSRKTMAYSKTRANYVVEWPETWPLKILSLNKDRRKTTQAKLKSQTLMKSANDQDVIENRECEVILKSLPSRQKVKRVLETKTDRNDFFRGQKQLLSDSKKEPLSYPEKISKQSTEHASSIRYSPPISPCPSSVERNPLGPAKASLPPITFKRDREKVYENAQRSSHTDTCKSVIQVNEERRCLQTNDNDSHDAPANGKTNKISQENDEDN